MFKWILLAVLLAGLAVWLRRGQIAKNRSNPETKQLEQSRFYVTPPSKDDAPPDDKQGTSL